MEKHGRGKRRRFSAEYKAEAVPVNAEKLEESLDKLSDADLLLTQGIAPEASYRFRHALIQDAAYQSLLRSKRQHYHRLTARALRDRCQRQLNVDPPSLGRSPQ